MCGKYPMVRFYGKLFHPPSFTVSIPSQPQRYTAIRDGDERLVTTIEVLSPANKTEDGYEGFRRRQEQRAERSIHLAEIDLLAKGKRRWRDERVDQCDYVMTVQHVMSSHYSLQQLLFK